MLTSLSSPFVLVSSPMLEDDCFQQAVILIVEYNKHGAIGFILNKPKPIALNSVVKNTQFHIPDFIPTWFGGPVSLNSGIVLADQTLAKSSVEDATIVQNAVSLSSNNEAIQQLVNHAETFSQELQRLGHNAHNHIDTALYPYRFVVGYSGWGPGQLEAEIRRGSWLEVTMDLELVFRTPWDQMWDRATQHMGVKASAFTTTAQPLLN
jgi:putative transcriptional regulator